MSDTQTLFRYEVPKNDLWVPVRGCDTPLAVAARKPDMVEFWARPNGSESVRWFRIYGTGRKVPGDALYLKTTVAYGGYWVYHLWEHRNPPDDERAPA